jgi:hypothetical protein
VGIPVVTLLRGWVLNRIVASVPLAAVRLAYCRHFTGEEVDRIRIGVAGNPARLVRRRGTTEITHRVRGVPPFA